MNALADSLARTSVIDNSLRRGVSHSLFGPLVALTLCVAYLPLVLYQFAWHNDYDLLLKPPPTGQEIVDLIVFNETSFLLKIGRPLNALLVNLQFLMVDTVAQLQLARGFFLCVLLLFHWVLGRLFHRHFRLSLHSATILSALICLTPPMQLAVFISTFSAPAFLALGAALASYRLFHRATASGSISLSSGARWLGALCVMVVSFCTYPPATMFFVSLVLLELIVLRVANGPLALLRFLSHVLAFVLGSLVLYSAILKIVSPILEGAIPAVLRVQVPPAYYNLSFDLASIDNRLYNFMLTFRNAANLWDMATSSPLYAVSIAIVLTSLTLPFLRVVIAISRYRTAAWRMRSSFNLGVETTRAVCKLVLFLTIFLPFAIPDQKATWNSGYRDSYRTLVAVEAGILFLGLDVLRQLRLAFAMMASEKQFALVHATRFTGAISSSMLVVAALLAFRSMNLGANWANEQLRFYEAIERELVDREVATLVIPCHDLPPWLWITPGVPGEYGYTAIGSHRYMIRDIARENGDSVGFAWRCGDTRTSSDQPYILRHGPMLYVDVARFVSGYYMRKGRGGWPRPSRHEFSIVDIPSDD